MKILHVITSLEIGGAEILLKELAIDFVSMGHEVTIVTFLRKENDLSKICSDNGVQIIQAPCNQKFSLWNLIFLWNFLAKKKFDIVHTHLTWDFYALAFVRYFLGHSKTKFITTEHSTTKKRRKNIFIRLFNLEKNSYYKYDKIICVNDEVKNALIQNVDVREKCELIVNGVNIRRFNATYLAEERLRSPVILHVGTLCEWKQQHILIKALTIVPDVELWLVGRGPNEGILKQLVLDLNLSKRVKFLGKRFDIPELMKTAVLYIQPSLYEGLSIAILEAMASGLPVIASDVPGMHEVISGVGDFFKAGDWKELAKIINTLMCDSVKLNRMSELSNIRAQQFSIETTEKKYIELYKKLIN